MYVGKDLKILMVRGCKGKIPKSVPYRSKHGGNLKDKKAGRKFRYIIPPTSSITWLSVVIFRVYLSRNSFFMLACLYVLSPFRSCTGKKKMYILIKK